MKPEIDAMDEFTYWALWFAAHPRVRVYHEIFTCKVHAKLRVLATAK